MVKIKFPVIIVLLRNSTLLLMVPEYIPNFVQFFLKMKYLLNVNPLKLNAYLNTHFIQCYSCESIIYNGTRIGGVLRWCGGGPPLGADGGTLRQEEALREAGRARPRRQGGHGAGVQGGYCYLFIALHTQCNTTIRISILTVS